jgi:hydrogenase nickel incorporation protein HypB
LTERFTTLGSDYPEEPERTPFSLLLSTKKFWVKSVMKIIKAKEGEVFDIELEESLLAKNRQLAEENRRVLDENGILAIDVMGSVGSGKTTLISHIVKRLKRKYRIACLAGDLTTTIDAENLKKAGAKVVQINTGKECHLDANLIRKALKELPLKNLDLIFIENVGNLICPAEFPLGSHKRVVVVSFSEGPFIIRKHPYIFLNADLVVINKKDLAQRMNVSFSQLQKEILTLKPKIKVLPTIAKRGIGVSEVIEGLGL